MWTSYATTQLLRQTLLYSPRRSGAQPFSTSLATTHRLPSLHHIRVTNSSNQHYLIPRSALIGNHHQFSQYQHTLYSTAAMTSGTPKSVLVMGIKQDNSPGQQWSQPEARKAVQAEFAKAKEAGYDLTTYLVDTNSSTTVDEVKQLLKSKQWDGVLIGFGIRGDISHSLIFTDLVNAAIREVSPPPRMIFATRPDRLIEVMDREFHSQ